MVQDVLEDLQHQFPVGGVGLQQLVVSVAAQLAGISLHPPLPQQGGLPYNEELSDIAEFAFFPTGVLLQSFLAVIKNGNIPVYKPGYYGNYNAKADRLKMSVVEKFNEDKILLLELLPEYCVVANFGALLPVRDEITAGFVEYYTTKDFNLWHCFASQVVLDAHHATRYCRLSAAADLRMSGLCIARTIDDYFKLSKTHPHPEFWPKEGDLEIEEIRNLIATWIEGDPLLAIRMDAYSVIDKNNRSGAQQLLFSRNPVICGILVFSLKVRMQIIGQSLLSQWFDVQQLAFLYNLVQLTPGLKFPWPDMELFLKIHGESNIFVGDRPKDAAQSLNRLELVTGISSATRFAKDSRKKQGDFHKPDGVGSARRLKPTATKAVNLVRNRYLQHTPGYTPLRSIEAAEVGKFLEELSKESTMTAVSKTASTNGPIAQTRALLGRKWRNTRHVGTLQLLAVLKGKLFEEEPILMFDYFGMHKRSMELFRLIKAKEHHKFVQYFTERYMPSDAFLPNLTILIHHVARGSAESGKAMGLGSTSGRDTFQVSRMVTSCGEVMESYLKNNGDATIKYLKLFAKNKKQLLAIVEEHQAAVAPDAGEEKYFAWFCTDQFLGPNEMESLKTGIPLA